MKTHVGDKPRKKNNHKDNDGEGGGTSTPNKRGRGTKETHLLMLLFTRLFKCVDYIAIFQFIVGGFAARRRKTRSILAKTPTTKSKIAIVMSLFKVSWKTWNAVNSAWYLYILDKIDSVYSVVGDAV